MTTYQLNVLVDIEERQISVTEGMIADAEPILVKMDNDMAAGWQLGREYLASPTKLQCAQIAANRLLTALHTQNEPSMSLMAAYILTRLPGVAAVNINVEGESGGNLVLRPQQFDDVMIDSAVNTGNRFRELKPGSFVYALDNALDPQICDQMIRRFEQNHEQQYQGRIGENAQARESIKQSTDLRISGRRDWADIDAQLQRSLSHGLGLLSGLHPFFQANQLNDIGYNLQRTNAGEFYHWHADSGPGELTKRQLVAIWYLSPPPPKGGETEFYFQQLSIRPKAGMLLLFPPFWTHVHRGKTVESGTKYIATTWVCVA